MINPTKERTVLAMATSLSLGNLKTLLQPLPEVNGLKVVTFKYTESKNIRNQPTKESLFAGFFVT